VTGAWDRFARELDAWGEAGRTATLWWRDDDATDASPELDALLQTAAGAPVALAVIPHAATDSLSQRLASQPNVTVLQHGYAHTNHAPAGGKKMELGPHRRADHVIAELATGQDRLARMFGSRFLPVMVPPWNRIAPFLVPMLPEMKYTGLSTFAPRTRAEPVVGFRQVNTHVDLIDWRGSRAFVGADRALEATVEHLADRRLGRADPEEATGLLTHHLVQGADSWAFMSALLTAIDSHPAAGLLPARELFEGTA
jgi:hypothetical protein